MFCPKCQQLGLKSKVYPGHSTYTLAGFMPYYDEEGMYHHHDANTSAWTHTCSQGHQFIHVAAKSCPNCDWGYPESTTVLEDSVSSSVILIDANGTLVATTKRG